LRLCLCWGDVFYPYLTDLQRRQGEELFMPQLSDLLSDKTDRSALEKLRQKPKKERPKPAAPRQPPRIENPPMVLHTPNFVAIDFETTGLEPKQERIIEVGLAKFVGGECRETYTHHINPGKSIPAIITNLTGITDAMVADAPPFESLAATIVAFVSDLPICGHQVEFDFNFLNQELARCGLPPIINQQIDTAVLGRIMLPGISGYSLTLVSKALNIKLESAHRALDDALASGHIAAELIPRLVEIPVRARRRMAQFAPHSVLKKLLLKSVDFPETPQPDPWRSRPASLPRLGLPEEPQAIDPNQIAACLDTDGALAGLVPGFAPRPGQIRMAQNVATTLNDRGNLVVEAGTGVGKSLAYLIPAAFWAFTNQTRVLISTYTRNLQDQLLSNDLPTVKKVVGAGLRFSVLKGRANYLCLDRWQRLLSGEIGNLSRYERFGLLALIRWAEETVTGDIEEQSQFNRRWFPKVWNLVAADSHECKGRRCPMQEQCFVQLARQKALTSHIVIINHALFFSDICAETSFLNKTAAIVFDEAHHLESCGHRYLRVEIDTNRINAFVEYLNNLVKMLENLATTAEIVDMVKQYKAALKSLRRTGQDVSAELLAWVVRTHADSPRNFQHAYRDTPFAAVRSMAELAMMLTEMQDILLNLNRMLAAIPSKDNDHAIDIGACQERTSQLKADLVYLSSAVTEDHVFWIEGDREKGWIKLSGVPLDVGALLNPLWRQEDRTTIFTSATLAVSGSMDFFLERVGLRGEAIGRTRTEIVQSPFTATQMHCSAIRSAMDPTAAGYDVWVAEAIAALLNRFQKNILALFTANEMLNSVYDKLKNNPSLPRTATVFGQNASANRHLLLEQFKQSRHSALLGTDSFWEGVDAPGEACEIVVIARLPFAVPTHPLAVALAEQCARESGDAFFTYAVPQAVIKFKQGAGRLIRTPSDRGALIVLDPRILTKGYGKVFMRSIDSAFNECASIDEALNRTAAFFEGGSAPSGPRYVPLEESC
jgi:ATP-dependent DNA helicase DinG